MTDLISRADAIEAIRKELQDWGSYAFEDYRRGLYEAQDIIDALPSADAVEVVRCGDCKHHEKFLFDDSKLLCWVHDIDIVVSPTDYCSLAERREDGEA